MHPRVHAASFPDKPAMIVAETGETVSFADLERRSNQGAWLLRGEGLVIGDRVAVLLENTPRLLEIAWSAQRAGLYIVAISTRLLPSEVEFILRDSGAKLLVASQATAKVAAPLFERVEGVKFYMTGGTKPAFLDWDAALAAQPSTPIQDERAGSDMLYSSGTTGRPKGIKPKLPEDPAIEQPTPLATLTQPHYDFGANSIYLCPAPLYHAAPLRWSMAAQRLGGTVVIMQKFEAEIALWAIEQYRVTVAQFVPTHFVRMLKLPATARSRYDLSSFRLAIHAAAPCPVPVKQAMIDWWGPILMEYYAGTEFNGLTLIWSDEWLKRPGSVGRALIGAVHICGDDGEELPPRTEGTVYFSGGNSFDYHNDPGTTAAATNRHGWTTLGDVGWLDEDGYLFLTDRKSFMIISGGVNIYPQEVENLLITHPRVADVAVIGAPDPDMGEKVVAVIQPADWRDATDALADELAAWTRERISPVKMPRQFDFMEELPRHPTGKLYKRLLRDKYWQDAGTPH